MSHSNLPNNKSCVLLLLEAAVCGRSSEEVLLKILQYSQENACAGVSAQSLSTTSRNSCLQITYKISVF